MSLVELIAQADERGLAASGLGCLDRCVPLLGATEDDEALRPLWTSLADGGTGWSEGLAAARGQLRDTVAAGEAAELVRRMLGAAPDGAVPGDWRGWADACSVAALQVHRMLDSGAAGVAEGPAGVREGSTEGVTPLVAAELRRQTRILELLASGAGGLRQARDLSTEGRRVLRAVVSRRARGRV
ncbi:hypothetical protein GTW43_07890 [Streptomyces sp. SID5785]|uniref:hypothetical protein n=1 Tax=Streptomyces sp. SID5785 TaxID=2690309 RepID=UPI001360EE5B|nr:hypothetical protein [Streptomyces sp. SID5785]MZD05005.1 hypothetical protein [Streptomyces sp. SID5785]